MQIVHPPAEPLPVHASPGLLLACGNAGLERHIGALLDELGHEPLSLRQLPTAQELLDCRRLILDIALLGGGNDEARAWIARRVAQGIEVVLIAPLNDLVAGAAPQGWQVLHKPVRKSALAALLKPTGAGPAAVPPRLERAQPQVLLCEDNPVNQVVIQAMLAELGAQCRIAGDGLAALQLLEDRRFDLVLMDVQMPELDGLETTRRWRLIEAQRGGASLPIVAMTADTQEDAGRACREAGMDGFLAKPFGLAALEQCLRQRVPA